MVKILFASEAGADLPVGPYHTVTVYPDKVLAVEPQPQAELEEHLADSGLLGELTREVIAARPNYRGWNIWEVAAAVPGGWEVAGFPGEVYHWFTVHPADKSGLLADLVRDPDI